MPLTSTDGDAVTRTMESPVSSAPVGTLAYMAPEVLSGQEATAPSDIWSLGVLLYEMAGGTPPFTGTTQTDVVSAIVKDSPAPLPTKVSPGLRNVIQHCLIKEPARRYPHPSAIQAALAAIQSDATVPRPVGVGPPGGTWMRPVVGAVIVLVVVAGLIVSVLRRSSPETSGSEVPRLTNPVQVTSAAGQESSPRWSPDGRMLAYSSRQNGNWDIWLAALGGEDPVNRTGGHLGRDDSPSWSPDGQLIAYLSYRDNGTDYLPGQTMWPPSVFGVSPLGGEARKLGAFSDPLAGLQWLSGGAGTRRAGSRWVR